MAAKQTYRLGLSPCPNDTFIFYALLHGLVDCKVKLKPHMADVEELNNLVMAGELPFSKLSLGVVSQIMDKYALLSSGAALGFGCGPLVVARSKLGTSELKTAKVAIPGLLTTANLLLTLTDMFHGQRCEMLFSDVMGAVARGEADVGVIIHEGRFTYAEHGLVKILDLGEFWEKTYNLPLPLGAIAVRRDLDRDLALDMEKSISASVRFAWQNPDKAQGFIREHAQELEPKVIEAHIKTFVTKYSEDLGDDGRAAITHLVTEAAKLTQKNIPKEGLFLV